MSTLKVDNFQTTGGASLFLARVWGDFGMSGTAALNSDGGLSSLTDLGTGTPQFNFDNALPSASGASFCSPTLYGSTTEYPVQNGSRIASTTTGKGYCGSDSTTRVDWYQGYFGLVR